MGEGGGDTDLALGATLDEHRGAAVEGVPRWLGDRYRVVRLLGRGGMGAVYLAVDEAFEAEVALKAITADVADALPRLRDEVRLAQKVTHPNVCRTYDLEQIEGHWLVKMERVAGETLAARLKRGPLPVAEAVRVATKICAGLEAAHQQGVVHRDLKPHNVMVESGTGRVVLMDFGIARAVALAGTTAENVSGTPDYMAPEQVRGREVNGRADLYALGCVLYELLTGERVFPRETGMAAALAHVGDPPPPLPAGVPAHVARVVARLLEKDPARRPQRADEVAAALAPAPRRRWGWLAAGAVFAAAAVAGLVALRPGRRWQPQIRVMMPVHDENSSSPVFSPDGKLVAYPSDREERGVMRAYVVPVEGGTPRAVSPRGLDVNEVRWEHDGKALLLSGGERRIHRVPLDGGPPEVVAEGARWVNDCAGRLVILYDGGPGCAQCQRLVLREPDGHERDLVQFPAGATAAYPRCDRAGRRVLYSLTDVILPVKFAPYDLWLLEVDGGSPRQLTKDRAFNIGTFTPDGRTIVYSAGNDDFASHLWEMPLDGGAAPVQRTFSEGAEFEPDVSPDGRLVVYDVNVTGNALFSQPIAGGRASRLTSDVTFYFHLQPTPDGREVIAEALPNSVVRIPAEGGDPVRLADGGTPALTPDGGEVVYSDAGRVLARPRGGGASRPVTEVAGAILELAVGPDGRVHLMVARPLGWEAWGAPLAGGVAERELPAPWSQLVPAPRGGWSAEVEMLDRVHWRARFLPRGTAHDTSGASEVVGGGAYASYAWSPDGREWLYRRDGVLHRLEVESGDDQVVAADAVVMAVSTDEKTLFTTRTVGTVRRELITNFAERR